MVKYERTRLCGCGECRMKPISEGPCPLENDKAAIWLWARSKDQDDDETDLENEFSLENLILDTSSTMEEPEEDLDSINEFEVEELEEVF